MTLWRPPSSPQERTKRTLRSMNSGTLDGRVASAMPVGSDIVTNQYEEYDEASLTETGVKLLPYTDQFMPGAAGTVIFNMTYAPYHDPKMGDTHKGRATLHIYWNGVFQRDLSYTLTGRKLTLGDLASQLRDGDIITIKYWYDPEDPYPEEEEPDDGINFYVDGIPHWWTDNATTIEPLSSSPKPFGTPIQPDDYYVLYRELPTEESDNDHYRGDLQIWGLDDGLQALLDTHVVGATSIDRKIYRIDHKLTVGKRYWISGEAMIDTPEDGIHYFGYPGPRAVFLDGTSIGDTAFTGNWFDSETMLAYPWTPGVWYPAADIEVFVSYVMSVLGLTRSQALDIYAPEYTGDPVYVFPELDFSEIVSFPASTTTFPGYRHTRNLRIREVAES